MKLMNVCIYLLLFRQFWLKMQLYPSIDAYGAQMDLYLVQDFHVTSLHLILHFIKFVC